MPRTVPAQAAGVSWNRPRRGWPAQRPSPPQPKRQFGRPWAAQAAWGGATAVAWGQSPPRRAVVPSKPGGSAGIWPKYSGAPTCCSCHAPAANRRQNRGTRGGRRAGRGGGAHPQGGWATSCGAEAHFPEGRKYNAPAPAPPGLRLAAAAQGDWMGGRPSAWRHGRAPGALVRGGTGAQGGGHRSRPGGLAGCPRRRDMPPGAGASLQTRTRTRAESLLAACLGAAARKDTRVSAASPPAHRASHAPTTDANAPVLSTARRLPSPAGWRRRPRPASSGRSRCSCCKGTSSPCLALLCVRYAREYDRMVPGALLVTRHVSGGGPPLSGGPARGGGAIGGAQALRASRPLVAPRARRTPRRTVVVDAALCLL